jgi:hypothetical protein
MLQSFCIQENIPIYSVQLVLNHKSSLTTARYSRQVDTTVKNNHNPIKGSISLSKK